MNETADFINMMNRIATAVDRIPQKAAVVAVNFSKERFVMHNWVDNTRHPWKERSKNPGWGRRERKGRGLLVDTGRLRRSIRIIYVSESYIIIGTDVPYARVHNEGFKGEVTQHVRAYTRGRVNNAKKGTGVYSIGSRREHTKTVRERSGDVKVSAHTRVIIQNTPARQFIGPSAVLIRREERMMQAEIVQAIKNR